MSVDFVEMAKRAKDDVDVPWDELRAARVRRDLSQAVERERRARRSEEDAKLQRLEQRLQGEPVARRRWLAGALLVAAASLVLWLRLGSKEAEQASSAGERPALAQPPWKSQAQVKLKDGSRSLLGAKAQLEVVTEKPSWVELRQQKGRVRYEVVPNRKRRFVVRCRGVVVTVLGTVFDVRAEARLVTVAVTRGRVRVEHGGKTVVLGAGKRLAIAVSQEPGTEERGPKEDGSRAQAVPSARVEQGDTSSAREAPSALPKQVRPAVSVGTSREGLPVAAASLGSKKEASPEALLARSDAARRRGDVAEARRVLRRFIADFPRDGRIVTVRYSLARLLRAKGQHRAAAQQFEACGRGLRGDALAEAAYSWQLAGEGGRAALLAARYLQRFPSGVHAARMRQLSAAK